MDKRVRVSIRKFFEFVSEWVEAEPGRLRKYAYDDAAELLLGLQSSGRVTRINEWNKANRLAEVSLEAVYELGRRLAVADVKKFAQALVETDPLATTAHLPRGDAAKGEIEVTTWAADDLLRPDDDPKRYWPASKYVSLFVDRVRFRMRDTDGRVRVRDGKYVRIDVPDRQQSGEGAVVLAVDRDRPEALLVVQYRHGCRRFLTEAIRGFGALGIDRTEYDTAARELAEEGGVRPAEGVARSLTCLRTLYTDTGKLSERPAYFLALVDRAGQEERLNRDEPLMEIPIWVPLRQLCEAVRSEDGVVLEHGAYRFVFDDAKRALFGPQTDAQGRFHLIVEDVFTTAAVLLAEPHLRVRHPGAFSVR